MRVRRLLADEHAERLKQLKCPRCKNHALHSATRGEDTPHLRYEPGEIFWACSGPAGQSCYLLSSAAAETIFETSDGTKAVCFDEAPPQPPPAARIVRRRHGECVDITRISRMAI
jgi:hypothetical protein